VYKCKTLIHVASKYTRKVKRIRKVYEMRACVEEIIFYPRDIHRDSQRIKLGTLLEMEVHSLKAFEKAVIHL
jgi:hypothetical protein